jgi:peptidoglycan hydrolase-like protein with peptidoglycan-binding domain
MSRLALLAAVLGVAAAAAPAPALAQDTTPTTPTTPPAPKPAPVDATLRLSLDDVERGGAVLTGTRFVVKGTVRPYVAGQEVAVRFYRRGKKIAVKGMSIQRDGAVGRFQLGFRTSTPGRLTIRASHRATAEMGTAVAKARHVDVLPRRAGPGSKGLAVRVLQSRLSRLGYVVGQRGVYDARTARAVLAFRKVTGMARTSTASEEVFGRLARGWGRFRVRFPQHGRHIEADISKQVLALINGRKVERIYPMSSGKASTPTILGTFRVYRKEIGTNSHGMVNSSYFIRGYAIHGYADVPVYNASHGCLRVPIPDSMSIYSWVRFGTIVDTYR